jgi:hypothetical protein
LFGQPTGAQAAPAPASGFGAFCSVPAHGDWQAGPPPNPIATRSTAPVPVATDGLFGTPTAPVTNLYRGGAGGGGASEFGGGSSSSAFGVSRGIFGAFAPAVEAAPSAPAPQPEDEGLSGFEEITGPRPFSEPMTVIIKSPLSVSYAVEGESTIPSDGIAHQVSVAVLSFDSKVTHVCCPKIEPRVYLQVS